MCGRKRKLPDVMKKYAAREEIICINCPYPDNKKENMPVSGQKNRGAREDSL